MTRPNIVLITSDQLRADCLGIAGHPDVLTGNLDDLARSGARFSSAYSPAPVCSPARRSILTGRSPAADGCLHNYPVRTPREQDTLPNLLRRAGYQTAEIGRTMHQFPAHARYGFEVRELNPFENHDSRAHTVVRRACDSGQFGNWPHLLNHGLPLCGYGARPWPYEEAFHQTTWTVNRAIDFAGRRDEDAPLFLHVGFVAPHPPLTPPACYYERYAGKNLAPPAVGDWADPHPRPGPYSSFVPADGPALRYSMAGYYGLVNHLDDMLHNLLWRYRRISGPTYFLFCSDHGEMLGDHHMFRKCRPYQGSVHVPFFLAGPDIPPDTVIDAPITLEDILPTCCELAGVDIPDHVEGQSLLQPIGGNCSGWREFTHIEQGDTGVANPPAFHCLTDGNWKYIWFSGDGREQLFNLQTDPREIRDLSAAGDHAAALETWRQRLAQHLVNRPEGFSKDGALIPGRPHHPILPHAIPV